MPTVTERLAALEQIIAAKRAAASQRNRLLPVHDLYQWGLRFVPHYLTDAPGQHHLWLGKYLVEMSKNRGTKLNFIAPRDSAKSTFISFISVLYDICEHKENYIVLIADVYKQAVKYLGSIKHELVYNENLNDAYPLACGEGEKWSEDEIVTANGVRIEALGAGMKLRGRKERQNRPTKIIVDDPQGDEIAYSNIQREHDWNWFSSSVLKAGSPHTNIIVAGTNIHRQSIVGQVRELPGWTQKFYRSIETYPARMDLWTEWEQLLCRASDETMEQKDKVAEEFYQAHKDEMEMGASVLWPAREPLKALMLMRITGSLRAFESEKQNNPIDPSKCDWPESCFTGSDLFFNTWPDNLITVCALDPSLGKHDHSGDFQAMLRVGYHAESGNYFVDCDCGRRPMNEMVTRYCQWCADAKCEKAVCEADQFQELLQKDLAQECKKLGLPDHHEGILTGGIPKIMRIRRISPLITRRRLRFKRTTGTSELIRQMQDFPNGQWDDAVDSAEMAIRTLESYIGHSKGSFGKGGFFG